MTVNSESALRTHSQGYNAFVSTIVFSNPEQRLAYGGDWRTVGGEHGWLAVGSYSEDEVDDEGGIRPLNHFYNPLNHEGLSDHPILASRPLGRNSHVWAAWFDSPSLDGNKKNEWAWQNARAFQWSGLTDPMASIREGKLAQMFCALGHVAHLLQDASQPEHVRNDQHLEYTTWRSAIEKYQREHVTALNYGQGIIDWRPAGFVKMRDFWDRDQYTGHAPELTADVNGGQRLGLAEFSNGNFLGGDAMYREYFPLGHKHYFPFPSLLTSTDFDQVKNSILNNWREYLYPNGVVAKHVYLRKIAGGVPVQNHCRLTYLGVTRRKNGGDKTVVSTTINDEKVLGEYHSILIPKAVEYSAGILDYFFRGKLGVTVGCDIVIKNESGQGLKGGEFRLYWDDSSGNRTQLLNPGSEAAGKFTLAWNADSVLPDTPADTCRHLRKVADACGRLRHFEKPLFPDP